MFEKLYAGIGVTSPAAIIISLALMLFCGFLATRLTRLVRLPDVTAYIITGIILGPCCIKAVPQQVIDGTGFLSDIALAFIAFTAGEFFKIETLKKSGLKVVVVTIFEALMASVIVFIVCSFMLNLSLEFSLVLAALASATAPASTMMTIRQTGAKGELVDTLLQVVALDDVVALLAYSAAIAYAVGNESEAGTFDTVIVPIIKNLGVLTLGGLFGVFLSISMQRKHSDDNRLIIALGFLLAFCGICSALDVSPLIGCMSMGMVYINMTSDDKLFRQLSYFSPPILLMFFVRSGLNFKLQTLTSTDSIGGTMLLTVGIFYFAARIIGKYLGSLAGCKLVHKSRKVTYCLGLALIPQAGVAIGLADMCARILGGTIGSSLQTIILSSSILYEMIGPACAKLSLYLSGSYSKSIEEITDVDKFDQNGQEKTGAQLLIERIAQVEASLPKLQQSYEEAEDEAAFDEAAYSQYQLKAHKGRFINR